MKKPDSYINLKTNMITKIAKCAAMMLTVVSAQHGISPLEFFEEK